jgi:tetratricopeptide (TPR) repeat protein
MPYGFRHLVGQDGETWLVPRKFLNDALELEKDKVVGYKVLEDHYHLWYIAKSYADCYGNSSELPFGKKHSDEYARRSIWYFERFLEVSHNWNGEGQPERQDEMAYFGLITMGSAYEFIGNIEKAIDCFTKAELFCANRNEHYLYLAICLERQKKYSEALVVIDKMMQPEKVNPFPLRTFLIEDRCYLDSSNFLNEYKERLQRSSTEHTIDTTSVKFEI